MYQISENLRIDSQLIEKYQWLKELKEQNIQDIQLNLFRVWCLDISHDLSLLVVGGISKDHIVYVYDQYSMTQCNQLNVTSHQVYQLLFSQNDKYLCAGCYGKQILLWNVDDVRKIQNVKYKRIIQTEFGVIARTLFFNNEKQLCFQGKSHLFMIDLENNEQAKTIKINHKPSSFDINQNKIYEIGNSSIIYIRDFNIDKALKFTCCILSQLEEIVVSKNNYFMVVASHQNLLFLNTINGKLIRKLKTLGKIQSIKLSSNDRLLIQTNIHPSEQLDKIQFINIETGQILLDYQTQLSQPAFISKMMPNKFIFGKINSIEIWNFDTSSYQL
ncbi:unnamed protein product [Paramecium sonneborni]|uniref:Uncharacterized protein n=1 Tax=Paramecium sonneborni TaxID=65129 RepID=A0A8S1PZ01_9CILI|nr:unnamed protein product [Paramecium sonneborni]CAD8108607.1 unnamed protein product [Paramecium sonneborni]